MRAGRRMALCRMGRGDTPGSSWTHPQHACRLTMPQEGAYQTMRVERSMHIRHAGFSLRSRPSTAHYSFDNTPNRWYILINEMFSNICFSGRLGDNRH